MITRYAAWCRRQAGTANCGHVIIAALAGAAVLAIALAWFTERFWLVICEVFWLTAGGSAAIALTYGVLVAGEHRARKWRRTRCQDCGTAEAVAEVTYANGLRSGTVRTCGPCWQRAEAAAGPGLTWDLDRSGPGLPRIAETPAVVLTGPEPADYACQPPPLPGWGLDPAAEAAQLRDGPAAAPDNEPASDARTAAELARVLEQAAPRIVPPAAWTKAHP